VTSTLLSRCDEPRIGLFSSVSRALLRTLFTGAPYYPGVSRNFNSSLDTSPPEYNPTFTPEARAY